MKNRHVKRWMLPAGIAVSLIVLVFALLYVLEYRASSIVRYLVETKTNGRFRLEAKDLDISLFQKRILLTDGLMQEMDTTTHQVKTNITIPKLYFQIQSWSSLYLQKKL